MTTKEALSVLKKYGESIDEIRIEDAMFGDGSKTVTIGNVFDNTKDANEFSEALKTLLENAEIKIAEDQPPKEFFKAPPNIGGLFIL